MAANGDTGAIAPRLSPSVARPLALRELGPLLATAGLPFLLVLYLALEGGGYDSVIRSEVGIAVWWIVLLGAATGVLPRAGFQRAAWAAIGILAVFAVWTGLGISWSESAERSTLEFARVAMLLGVLTLALSTQGAGGLRLTVYSVAAAIVVVAGLALLSRLHPAWFPVNATAGVFESAESRLSYPVNNWNGLAALMAIGVPLLLGVAMTARRAATRSLATAAVPLLVLVAFFTLSRGGAVELGLGVLTFVALYPRRLEALPTLILAGAGSALLIAAAEQRDQLADGLLTSTALSQGDEMIAMVLVVGAGVALLKAALSLAERHRVVPDLAMTPTAARRTAGATILAIVALALAAGLPGEVSDRWEEFKEPLSAETAGAAERFESASGNGRYQWWQAALDANSTDPVLGIGPGSYEFFWAREGTIPGFVKDAHSLFFETLAELGIIGLALVVGLFALVVAAGVRRSFAGSAAQRPLIAAATAACVAFMAAAAIDAMWELTVLPVVFLLLAAAIISGGSREAARESDLRVAGAGRTALAGLAILALAAIAIPLATTASVRASQTEVQNNRLPQALEEARDAEAMQPWASTPEIQEALVLELAGELDAAAAAARSAADAEPTNWRTWLVLSRIETFRGESDAAVAAYREARSLNPRSALFNR